MRSTLCFSAALFCLGALSLEAFPQTNLAAPHFTIDDVIGASVAIHDYRDKGIRVGPSYLREKLVIHNYGHGGASLPLAWGSAEEAYEYLQIEVLSDEFLFEFGEIAVLGAGVVGLSTANFFLDRGYKVHVYADRFPPHITHDPLEGIWWPTAVSSGKNWQERSTFKRILKHSYKHFEKIVSAEFPEYAGVSKRNLYSFDGENNHQNDAVSAFFGDGVHVAVSFDNGSHKQGMCYETFEIDPQAYIVSLYERALSKGATFTKQAFVCEDELNVLEENVIINCAGKGTMHLFCDPNLQLVRHQTLSLKPQAGIDYPFRAYHADEQNATTFFALGDRIVLGGDYQFDRTDVHFDLEGACSLIDSVSHFFE